MKSRALPLALFALTGPVFAQEKEDLEKRVAALEQTIQQLRKTDPAINEARNRGFDLKLTGYFHLDTAWFDGAQNRLGDGTILRRARLNCKFSLGKDWVGESGFDFAESSVAIKDMWFGYQGFRNSLIQVGHFKAPFGMDTMGSSNATWLLERSYSDLWTPDRRVGLAYSQWGAHWQAKVDFFGQSVDETEDVSGVDQGWGAAARFSFAPLLLADTQAVHLGFAASTRRPSATVPTTAFGPINYSIDFSGRPESTKVSKAKFLNLKMSNVDHFNQYGLEFAGVWKAFSWQSEYQQTKVFRRSSQVLVDTIAHEFSTYYGQVSWIFGGQRTYEVSSGLFGKVTPLATSGAWEVVARYSMMNQDDLTPVDPIKGGLARNLTLGLTFYLNKGVRWMLNYTKVDNNENAKPKTDPYGGIPNDDFNFVSTRIQVVF